MTVWGVDPDPAHLERAGKQPFIVAPNPQIAERFLQGGGTLEPGDTCRRTKGWG